MNTVLYYPQIYPTLEWLRLAALCWDKVYRLVPNTWENDPEEIGELDASLGGILASIKVREVIDTELQKQFGEWLDARAEKLKAERWSSEKSVEREALAGVYRSKLEGGPLIRVLKRRGLIRIERKPIQVQIPNWEKEDFLQPRLAEQGIALRTRSRAQAKYERLRDNARQKRTIGDFKSALELERKAERIRERHLVSMTSFSNIIYIPEDVALHYLALCAVKAATKKKCDLLANGQEFTDSIFYSIEHLRGEVATLTLQAYLPKNYLNLELQRIVEFRSEFASQRLKYQAEIQSVTDKYASVASEGELENIKKSIIEIAMEQIEETKKVYQRAKLEMAIKTFGLTLTPPAIAASIASALGIGIFAPAGIAAALSVFAAQLLLDWDKAESEKSKSPWSYVLDIAKM